MYDYNRGCCDNICYSGVADLFRLPKYSLAYYRSQMPAGAFTPAGPMPAEVFAASRWDEESSDTVVVLGNVAEVALFVNGKEVARRKPDCGPSTPYTPLSDGGNCAALASPPFTFTGIAFRPGVLHAVGYDSHGKEVAHHTLRTPGHPERIHISYFESGQPAGTHDMLIVYATLTDANGTPCHTNGTWICLEATGDNIIGPAKIQTEDGIASFIVKTGNRKVSLSVPRAATCGHTRNGN